MKGAKNNGKRVNKLLLLFLGSENVLNRVK